LFIVPFCVAGESALSLCFARVSELDTLLTVMATELTVDLEASPDPNLSAQHSELLPAQRTELDALTAFAVRV
jgi:hypothetical protein